MSNSSYTPTDGSDGTAADRQPRSSEDGRPSVPQGTGETSVPAIGSRVKHRLSGAAGEVVDHQADPFVKDLTHGIVNWTGDGDGFGQGYSNTNLIKF